MIIATSIGNFYKFDKLEERAKKFSDMGFDAVEMTTYEIDRWDLNKVLNIIKEFNFKVTDLHVSFNGFIDLYPDQLKTTLLSAINIAKKIDTNVITFHSGRYKNLEMGKKNLISAIEKIVDYANDEGIKLAIENSTRKYGHVITSESDIEWILSQLPISLLYDISHGTNDGEDVYKIIERWKSKLFGIHVSDANFNRSDEGDEHLPLNEGEIDFEKFSNIIRGSGSILILELQNHGNYGDLSKFKQFLGAHLGE